MNVIINVGALIALAIVTQHIVAWAGSILHEVGNTENNYAVFTFRDDRNMPMTTNIIMNICIPNVFMVFIYMISKEWNLKIIEEYLMVYVIAFYVYRMFLICVILRRKEMYSFGYEFGMAIVGIAIAWMLNNCFFVSVKNVFIGVEELKEELWIVIFVILYQFLKLLLDKRVTQDSVLKKGQISRYIINKFNKFYARYSHLMDINIRTSDMYIFLYAIMIFEDYNRGPIYRFFERFKVRLGKSTTVGIMQIKSDKPLSDEESIIECIEWLENRFGDDKANIDVMQVKDVAWEYNNDEAYAKSVAYIYECLYEYLDEVPKYRKIFCMREDIEEENDGDIHACETEKEINVEKYTQIACKDTISFLSSIHNNSYINIEKNTYDLLSNINEVTNVEISEVYDGKELLIKDINNVYIRGNGAELIVKPRYATVLTFVNCHDIVLENMKVGHTPTGECAGGVLRFENCSNVRLKNLEIYGCGVMGISSQNSDLYVEECRIHSCTDGAIELFETRCAFDRVEIFDCTNTWNSIISANKSNVIISDSIIRDCSSQNYIVEVYDTVIISNNLDVYDCEVEKAISNCDI